VGRVEGGVSAPEDLAAFNGKPVVLVGVYLSYRGRPSEVDAAVREKLKDLRGGLPDGVELSLAFDFARNLAAPGPDAPEYLRLDLQLPDGASAQRTAAVAARCTKLVRETAGVQDVLSVSGEPFAVGANQACLLVSLVPPDQRKAAREAILKDLRARLEKEIREAAVYLCDLTGASRFPGGGTVLELAVEDRGGLGHEALQRRADALVEKLRKNEKWTDVRIRPDSRPQPQLYLEIDRAKVQALGLTLKDIFDTLNVFLGEKLTAQDGQVGRTIQVTLQADARRDRADLKKLQVRNAQGEIVTLGSVISVRPTYGPAIRERFNMYPAVTILGNPAPGVTTAEARRAAEALAEQELPAALRVEWVSDTASRK
jgi:multidrug efflux pump